MNYRIRVIPLVAFLTVSGVLTSIDSTGSTVVYAQTQKQNVSITTSEGAAIKTLRSLLSAETTFQNTVGKGEFGSLKDLIDANLIDKKLAGGIKDNYKFSILTKRSTLTTHPAVDLVARPIEYGKLERRSFYLTEAGVMLTSEVKDAPLTAMQPFATGAEGRQTVTEPKNEAVPGDEADAEAISGEVSANETSIIASLSSIHAAEVKYIAKAGVETYGTLDQLAKSGLLEKAQSDSIQFGYQIEVKIAGDKPGSSATFSVTAIPQTYGTTGRRSFLVDQTGVVRGADKEGGSAEVSDPAIKNQ